VLEAVQRCVLHREADTPDSGLRGAPWATAREINGRRASSGGNYAAARARYAGPSDY